MQCRRQPRPASVGLPLAHPKEFDGLLFGELPQFGVASHQDGVLLPGRFHGKRVRVRDRVAALQASRAQDQSSVGEEGLNRHHREVGKEPLGGRGPVALRDQVEDFADVEQRDADLGLAALSLLQKFAYSGARRLFALEPADHRPVVKNACGHASIPFAGFEPDPPGDRNL